MLLRRVDGFLEQRGLRELMVTTFPGGVVDCSSWAGLTEAVDAVFGSKAWKDTSQKLQRFTSRKWFQHKYPKDIHFYGGKTLERPKVTCTPHTPHHHIIARN